MTTNRLDYTIKDRCGDGCLVISTGSLQVKTIRRVFKYDGWKGYAAYVLDENGKSPRWVSATAGTWKALCNKISKLPGAATRS